jgi:hypothetical protein
MNWRKIPSVTTGGKPYFYHAVDPNGGWLGTVCWNRSFRAYACEAKPAQLLGYASTVAQGKAIVRKALHE